MKLKINVVPNSPRDNICGYLLDVLKIKVWVVPELGKENKAVLSLLRKNLNYRKGS